MLDRARCVALQKDFGRYGRKATHQTSILPPELSLQGLFFLGLGARQGMRQGNPRRRNPSFGPVENQAITPPKTGVTNRHPAKISFPGDIQPHKRTTSIGQLGSCSPTGVEANRVETPRTWRPGSSTSPSLITPDSRPWLSRQSSPSALGVNRAEPRVMDR